MNYKNIGKVTGKLLLTFLVTFLTGFLLLLGAYTLPVEPMQNHLRENADYMTAWGNYTMVLEPHSFTLLDNYTDSIMLGTAICDSGKGTLLSAMEAAHPIDKSQNRFERIYNYLNNPEKSKIFEYGRYWHGYLIILKPLLLFFNYSEIRIIQMSVQIILLLLIVYLSARRKKGKIGILLGTSLLFIMPMIIGRSLQYSWVYDIMLCAVVLMLLFHDWFKARERYCCFFLVLGMLTSYMDLLTYPLITLGIPLVCLLLLNEDDKKNLIWQILGLSLCWGAGYGLMWFGKWFLASQIMDKDMIKDGLDKVLNRTSTQQDETVYTRWGAILLNLNMLNDRVFKALAAAVVLIQGILIVRLHVPYRDFIRKIIPFLIIAAMPFVWYLLAANHSSIHCWFTYRSLSVTIFALFGMMGALYCPKTKF